MCQPTYRVVPIASWSSWTRRSRRNLRPRLGQTWPYLVHSGRRAGGHRDVVDEPPSSPRVPGRDVPAANLLHWQRPDGRHLEPCAHHRVAVPRGRGRARCRPATARPAGRGRHAREADPRCQHRNDHVGRTGSGPCSRTMSPTLPAGATSSRYFRCSHADEPSSRHCERWRQPARGTTCRLRREPSPIKAQMERLVPLAGQAGQSDPPRVADELQPVRASAPEATAGLAGVIGPKIHIDF